MTKMTLNSEKLLLRHIVFLKYWLFYVWFFSFFLTGRYRIVWIIKVIIKSFILRFSFSFFIKSSIHFHPDVSFVQRFYCINILSLAFAFIKKLKKIFTSSNLNATVSVDNREVKSKPEFKERNLKHLAV